MPTATNRPPRHDMRLIANFIGENNADNEISTTAIVANADGSLLERVEYIQTIAASGTVATVDGTANATPADVIGNKTDAAVTVVGTTKSIEAYAKGLVNMNTIAVADAVTNAWATDAVGNKTDAAVTAVGTTKSIMAYAKGAISWLTVGVADAATNAAAKDVIGNKSDATVQTVGTVASLLGYTKGIMNALIGAGAVTFPTSAAPANAVSLGAVLREIYDQIEKVVQTTTAATMPQATTTIFTMAGGAYRIMDLHSICVTTNNANAATQQWSIDGTLGSATTISAASASLASLVAGDMTVLDMTALSTAVRVIATGTSAGLAAAAEQIGIVANGAGVIQNIIAAAATTGTWNHFFRYRPLARGVTATAAF